MNVVFPEDEGPATAITRTPLRSQISSAVCAMCFSWKPSLTWMSSLTRPDTHALL